MSQVYEGKSGRLSGRVAIVVSRYNESVTKKLLLGAMAKLRESLQEEQIVVAWVPGAWELAIVTKAFCDRSDIAGVVALGVVIKGETSHDQHINRAVSQALMETSLTSGKPVGFGLLTVQSLDQALNRAGGNVGNKGEETASAVLETLCVLQSISE